MSLKKCSKCGEFKELSEFNKDSSKKDGLQRYCRKCSNVVSTKHNREVQGCLPMSENETKRNIKFDEIYRMTAKERHAVCKEQLLTCSESRGCHIVGVDYNDCGKCPMTSVSNIHPLAAKYWYIEMKKIGYLPRGQKYTDLVEDST